MVRRHWFLRFIVVGLLLSSTVLISAHEIAIEFGIQIAILIAAVWWYRDRKDWKFKFSIETALLLMVVVAAASAVLGDTRELLMPHWVSLLVIGICSACYGLVSLWFIFGKTRLSFRIPLGLLSLVAAIGLDHSLGGLLHALWIHILWASQLDWYMVLMARYSSVEISEWLGAKMPTVLLGTAILCVILQLAKKSGWFSERTPATETAVKLRLPVLLSRVGLLTLFSGVLFPLLYIFYRLMTPAQLPVVEIQEPNGYDDFIAASKMIDSGAAPKVYPSSNLTPQELESEMRRLAVPLSRIKQGLSQPYFQVRSHQPHAEQADPANQAKYAISIESERLNRFGTAEQQVSWALNSLKMDNAFKFAGVTASFGMYEKTAHENITTALGRLDRRTCQQLAFQLHEHDRLRTRWDRLLLIERVAKENEGWENHLNTLLQTCSGDDPYENERWNYHFRVSKFRMLVAQVALQGYFLEHQQLPQTLKEMVPDYLPELPLDPFTGQAMKYQYLWGGYALTCSVDGRAQPLIVTGPAAPYFQQRLQAAWTELLDAGTRLKAEIEAASNGGGN